MKSNFLRYTMHTISLALLFVMSLLGTVVTASASSNLVNMAHNYANSGNHYKAYDTYWLAFRQNPEDIDINFNLGIEAAAIADYEAAVMAFERVLLIDPEATQAKIEIAKAFYRLGAQNTARQYFLDALKATDLPPESKTTIEEFLHSSYATH